MTDDTRSRILQVAHDLFAAQGYHATSIREIAERLELTKTAVLYHFPSKKEIIAALAEPLLADMEAAIDAANRAPGSDERQKRWAVIEGLLDVWLTHRDLLRLQMRDLALAAEGSVFDRFRDAAYLAQHLIAGPLADHVDRIRAAQAFGMLSDPVVMFADLPAEMLRPAVLSGVERLLEDRPEPPVQEARRRGRPGAMTPEAIERARRMHASGRHTAAEIARALGVSRATLYRHLSA
ncbi:TetR family transcriptional regulator [Nonomuraea sp. NPDC052116]|uniref:TetR family transcriptional regulator n=1 Tax=Nonomuraea sp. NPDC052116 TaxID=3155665 RepID=UPI00343B8E29